MDASTVARWRTLCLTLLGAFLGMSVIVYGVRLLPGDVDLHREIMGYRGTAVHGVARWLNYGGKWQFLAPAMLLLLACSPAARRRWWLWCGLLPIGGAVEQLFKFLVGRPLGGILLGAGCAAAGAWWDAAHPSEGTSRPRAVNAIRIGG